MTAREPIRYMVVCDHPELNRRYYVADIDDSRPVGGGIEVLPTGAFLGTTVEPMNKRGSRTVYPFTCGGCSLDVSLQATSLPDLLDKIGPHRSNLPSDTIEVGDPPELEADELADVLFNGAEPRRGWIVREEQRYVIQFALLCRIVGKLRAR